MWEEIQDMPGEIFDIEEMNPKLEMLSAREQLMEDIDCIISEFFQGVDDDDLNEVTRVLCDAVCRNFPSN